MLYLILTQSITFGQFFSLYIYSFFIFGPLQELGNVLNIFREAEASLNIFGEVLSMPIERKPLNPVSIGAIETLEFNDVSFKHLTASTYALTDVSFKTERG